jgi:hypothetical protein
MGNFEENIQKWVLLDNQLKILNEKIHDVRDKKSQLLDSITEYAEKNKLMDANIQISDGKLKFTKTRISEPLTFKYLEKSLSNIIRNEAQVKQIMEHIKNNRDIKIVPEMKRFS